jgi:hypothetical protein
MLFLLNYFMKYKEATIFYDYYGEFYFVKYKFLWWWIKLRYMFDVARFDSVEEAEECVKTLRKSKKWHSCFFY